MNRTCLQLIAVAVTPLLVSGALSAYETVWEGEVVAFDDTRSLNVGLERRDDRTGLIYVTSPRGRVFELTLRSGEFVIRAVPSDSGRLVALLLGRYRQDRESGIDYSRIVTLERTPMLFRDLDNITAHISLDSQYPPARQGSPPPVYFESPILIEDVESESPLTARLTILRKIRKDHENLLRGEDRICHFNLQSGRVVSEIDPENSGQAWLSHEQFSSAQSIEEWEGEIVCFDDKRTIVVMLDRKEDESGVLYASSERGKLVEVELQEREFVREAISSPNGRFAAFVLGRYRQARRSGGADCSRLVTLERTRKVFSDEDSLTVHISLDSQYPFARSESSLSSYAEGAVSIEGVVSEEPPIVRLNVLCMTYDHSDALDIKYRPCLLNLRSGRVVTENAKRDR